MFWESGAGYNTENKIFLDSIFPTNGCVGTHFMAVEVCMHKLKPKLGVYFMYVDADADKKRNIVWLK